MLRQLLVFLSLFVLAACGGIAPLTAPAPTPIVFQPMLGRGLSYLARQFDAEPGLLHASPDRPGEHWLAPDNLLALWVFQEANAKELAAQVAATLDHERVQENGLVEAIAGAEIAWPPKPAIDHELAPGIWLRSQVGDGVTTDWAEAADLALFAALNAWNRGDASAAHDLYTAALRRFDGFGFQDSGAQEGYASRPVALAVIAGQRMGEVIDPAFVARLRALQGADGGFYARYTAAGPAGATDTETTAYALLALYALREQPMFGN